MRYAAHCVQRTNIQNLKAIHNMEMNGPLMQNIVFKERIYKIWKQFTTKAGTPLRIINCVQRTNIQNLKAIHNQPMLAPVMTNIVFKERIYKIWKQFTTVKRIVKWCQLLCSKNEYTKSESNSQPFMSFNDLFYIVFKERIYKIWKQFTTSKQWGKA